MQLIDIFNELIQTGNSEKAVNELNKINMKGLVMSLLDKNTFNDEDKQNLMFSIRILQYIYNNSDIEPPVSDSVFDSLYELNKAVNLTDIVGSINPQGKLVVNHNYPDLRGTLDKIHFYYEKDKGKEKNKKSMEYWFRQVLNAYFKESMNAIREHFGGFHFRLLLMPKFDGVSVIIETHENHICERALTRGDTTRNEAIDLSNIFKGIDFSYLCEKYHIEGSCGIKLEVIMKQKEFKDYCKKFGKFNNPRAAVVSAIGNKENGSEILKYLTMQPLRIQDSANKITCIYDYSHELDVNQFPEMLEDFKPYVDSIIKDMEEREIPIDGVVFVILNPDVQKLMGRKDAINKYEFAYKFPTNRFRTKVIGIQWSIGKLGCITPVADLEPITCNGNTVDSATLSNIDRFNELKLHEGDEVIITYDIVPYLIIDNTCEKSDGKKFKVPSKCPICGKETYIDGAFLRCGNNKCPSKNIGLVLNYIEKMNIPNMNTETVNKFFKEGFLTCINDIYYLDKFKGRIVALEGFGPKSYQNIIDGINAKRNCTSAELLGSLGINSVGRTIFKKILDIYNLKEILEICENHEIDTLMHINGIGEIMAEKIIGGVNENLETIKFLKKQLNLTDSEINSTVTFTGFRNKEFEEFLLHKGIEVSSSFKKSLNYVVVNDLEEERSLPENKKSTKYVKALKNGVNAIDKKDYADSVGYKGLL